MTVGQRIRKLRVEKGLTQKELAIKCGMFDSAIRRYELGTQNPKKETLEKIAAALEVDPLDLLYDGRINFKLPDESAKQWADLTPEETQQTWSDMLVSLAKSADTIYKGHQSAMEDTGKAFAQILSRLTKDRKKAQLIEYYEQLNTSGRDEAVKRTEELTHIPKYTDKENSTDDE